MIKKISVFIFLISFSIGSMAQSKIYVSAHSVVGYNNTSLDVWKYKVDSKIAIGYQLGAGYQYYYKQKYFVNTGVFMSQTFIKAKINDIEVNGTKYGLSLPIELGIRFLDKWETSLGISIQNNRDFSDFDINSSDNVRFNFLVSASYWINDKWKTDLKFSRIISDSATSLLLTNYTSHFYLGVNYYIF